MLFATTLQQKLGERFPEMGTDRLERCAANYFDPRWKGAHLRLTNKLQITKLEMEMKYLGNRGAQEVEVELPNPSLSPTSKLIFNSQRESVDRSTPFQQEQRRYEDLPNPGRNADVMAFWKLHEEPLPLLSRMARIVLAIPAASSKSERVFSTGGLVVTQKRFSDQMNVFPYLNPFCQGKSCSVQSGEAGGVEGEPQVGQGVQDERQLRDEERRGSKCF